MKTKMKGLALTAMLLSSTSMTYAEQGASSVGDIPGFGEEAYFHPDATYAENAELSPANHVGDLPIGAAPAAEFRPATYEKIPASQMMPASFSTASSSYCDVGCDSGCDSAGGKRSKLLSLFDRCDCNGWAMAEGLIWFAQDRDMPALISTSAPGTQPILGPNNPDPAQAVFGDDIDGEISGGFRLDVGTYIGKNFGVGGRLWWMNNNDDSYSAQSDGSDMSIGRPFYNIQNPADFDALLVALDGNLSGRIAARSELKVWGGEAYTRLKLCCNKGSRVDLITGYTHHELDDSLGIIMGNFTNQGLIRTYADAFKTENRFDGGQFGFEMVMQHGRWSCRSLTKVHLGNMRQRAQIFGISTSQTPPQPVNVTSGGLLALGNQGDFDRNKFSFIPEANFKVGYCLRDNVNLSIGYSLIYWSNVALVGDIIDPTADFTDLNTGGPFNNRPIFKWDDSSLWVQGVDFGIVIDI